MSTETEHIDVLNEYKTHHYIARYFKSDLACPHCGSADLWDSGSECYVMCGCTKHICLNCNRSAYLSEPVKETEPRILQIIEQIKLRECFIPTTEKGN